MRCGSGSATATCVVALILAGCRGDGASADGNTSVRRDSAGVSILDYGSASPPHAWTLGPRPLFLIGGRDAAVGTAPIHAVSMFVDHQGRLIVVDGGVDGGNRLLAYGADGRFAAALGREGGGPCEFTQLWDGWRYRGDSIAAFDIGDGTISILDGAGACGRQLRLPTAGSPAPPGTYPTASVALVAFPDGRFLFRQRGALEVPLHPGPVWLSPAAYALDPEGQIVDSLGTLRAYQVYWNGSEQAAYPFGASAGVAVAGSGFWVADGESFEIRLRGPSGRLMRIVRRDYPPRSIEPREIEDFERSILESVASREPYPGAVERTRRRLAAIPHPQSKPATGRLLTDDRGRLWVEHYSMPPMIPVATDDRAWSVFAADGTWLADVTLPGSFRLGAVRGDTVVGAVTDTASGLESILAYPVLQRRDREPEREE